MRRFSPWTAVDYCYNIMYIRGRIRYLSIGYRRTGLTKLLILDYEIIEIYLM